MITADPARAVKVLAQGNLCAIPTETVYGLAADASRESAISQVFSAKGRPSNHPLIVHIGQASVVNEWIQNLPEWAQLLIDEVWPGPLTVVGPRTTRALDSVTGGQDTVAVRMPDHVLTLGILDELASNHNIQGLVAPSANRFGHVSPTLAAHVEADLGMFLDAHGGLILDGGPCRLGVESTIVLATGAQPVVLRPGGITRKEIKHITKIDVADSFDEAPRVSGALASHYAPDAQVHLVDVLSLSSIPRSHTAGVIALSTVEVMDGFVELSRPTTDKQFAFELYSALRKADELGLENVYVVPPTDEELAEAINDRLKRAAH